VNLYLPLSFLGLLILSAALASFAPYDPLAGELADNLLAPSLTHPFGTDFLGRDVFVRTLYGARLSLLVGVSVQVLALLGGMLCGSIAGLHYDGWPDRCMMYLINVVWAFPFLLLALALSAALGPGLVQLVLAISTVAWVGVARVVRGEVASLKEREFILAARALGSTTSRVVSRHLLPNLWPSLVVLLTLGLVEVIVIEAGLSFLGLGIQPPVPSWGKMIFEGKDFIFSAWWVSVFPGLFLTMTVLSFTAIGETLSARWGRVSHG
jgi:peptide/nickel transport system permease protein